MRNRVVTQIILFTGAEKEEFLTSIFWQQFALSSFQFFQQIWTEKFTWIESCSFEKNHEQFWGLLKVVRELQRHRNENETWRMIQISKYRRDHDIGQNIRHSIWNIHVLCECWFTRSSYSKFGHPIYMDIRCPNFEQCSPGYPPFCKTTISCSSIIFYARITAKSSYFITCLLFAELILSTGKIIWNKNVKFCWNQK